MNDRKPANPLVVVLLIVGIVGALGFALYRALAPAGGEAKAPTTASASEQQPKAATAASPHTSRQPLAGEDLAIGANPFARSSKGSRVATAPPPRPQPATPPSTGPLPAPLMVSRDRAARAQALNALAAGDRASAPAAGLPAPAAQPMPVSVEPELVGTMMGGRPTAVFKSDKSVVMVPQGGVYLGWRVVRVNHTEATVWNGGTTLRLRVGAPSTPVTHAASIDSSTSDAYATADMIVVHYRSLPAPTRQDLVYGRIEDPTQFGRTEDPQPVALPAQAEEAAPPSEPPAVGDPEETTTVN